ncbi:MULTISPECIES: DUF484 family protein [Idiomarinaceae]|uniref:DUF484 family protein n=4 Tax=Pseudidiomarina TaxID=2800384 RepID=A0A368UMX4_9GAMM|nr:MULTISPECIES: DUF484 family protein [Idiomarinaceae]MDT7525983.1 DUF484 family protein [Pseudidiomarina sp. GXY010]MDX1526759.1 DUF484 family protein [Pseudidiomarina maritima]MRJ41742.1 DUF484 family protein [Idiomarina sp. FeN1]NCU57732.1 DUF484 family protein [Idiomarina sp. FenA--70]NCU60284.1 DUF484 family protein [Idiomarina sp. FenBw--71]
MTGELIKDPKTLVDDTLIAEYLAENPDFFERHPQLLQHMRLRHEQQGTVSLVERQQQVLRQRVGQLEDDITELMITAKRNEQLFNIYSELYIALLDCHSLADIMNCLQATFAEQLNMPAVSLKFFASPLPLPEQFTFIADTHKQLLSKRFNDTNLYLGRLTESEQRLLFPEQAIASVALLLLGEQGELGMLAIGNQDASHFQPTMDAVLINQLRHLLSKLLPPLLQHQTQPGQE